MTFKSTNNGLSSLILFVFLLTGCFFDLNGQNCNIPTNVVSGNITPTTATFNWDAMPNATAYEVNYRPMNAPATQPWNTVAAPTNTATINALTPSTMYDVQVRSACGSDFSDYTVTTSFSTQNCVPPMNPAISNITANSADIQWTAVPGASGYQLLHRIAVSGGNPGAWNATAVTGNNYTLTGLVTNTLYAGRLMTNCGGFPSDTSKVFYFSTNPCSVPAHLLITAQTASSVSLSWDAVPNANQYNVQYRTAGNGTWSTVNTNTNSRTINSLTGNTAYEFRVRSNCGGGVTSAYTLIINGFTLPCAMPENAVISNVAVNSATVSWNNATGANQYRVDYREALAPTWTTINANNTTKTINNLQPNTAYEVQVRSRCSGNQYSANTETLTFQTKSCTVPQNFQATNIQYTSAQLGWNAVENATRYQLQYRLVGDTTWTTTNPDSTVRTINGLIPNSTYEARVRTKCANNVFSDYSPTITFSTTLCAVPQNLQITNVTFDQARFSWTAVPNATRYQVEYRVVGDTLWYNGTSDSAFKVLNNLNPGATYEARVRSRCANNVFSDWTWGILFETPACVAPRNIMGGYRSNTSVELVWDGSLTAQLYQIGYRLAGDTVWTHQVNSDSNRKVLNQLTLGNLYEVRVRSKCANGVFSDWVNGTVFHTEACAAPTNLQVVVLDSVRYRASWHGAGDSLVYVFSYGSDDLPNRIDLYTQDTSIIITHWNPCTRYDYRLYTACSPEQKSLFSTGSYQTVYMLPCVNQAPIGVNDHTAIWYNQSVTFNVFDNDTDADGDSLYFDPINPPVLVNSPGQIVINGQEITYIPDTTNYQNYAVVVYTPFDGSKRGQDTYYTIEVSNKTSEEDNVCSCNLISNGNFEKSSPQILTVREKGWSALDREVTPDILSSIGEVILGMDVSTRPEFYSQKPVRINGGRALRMGWYEAAKTNLHYCSNFVYEGNYRLNFKAWAESQDDAPLQLLRITLRNSNRITGFTDRDITDGELTNAGGVIIICPSTTEIRSINSREMSSYSFDFSIPTNFFDTNVPVYLCIEKFNTESNQMISAIVIDDVCLKKIGDEVLCESLSNSTDVAINKKLSGYVNIDGKNYVDFAVSIKRNSGSAPHSVTVVDEFSEGLQWVRNYQVLPEGVSIQETGQNRLMITYNGNLNNQSIDLVLRFEILPGKTNCDISNKVSLQTINGEESCKLDISHENDEKVVLTRPACETKLEINGVPYDGQVDVCQGESFTLKVNGTGGNPYTLRDPITGETSLHNANDDVIISPKFIDRSYPYPYNQYFSQDSRWYKISYEIAPGCSCTREFHVYIYWLLPNYESKQAICVGSSNEPISYTIAGNIYSRYFLNINNVNHATFLWSPQQYLPEAERTKANPTLNLPPDFTGPITYTATITGSYRWQNGFSITCTFATQVTIVRGSLPQVSVNDLIMCPGQIQGRQLTATAQGEGPFTYSWSPANGLSNATISNPTVTLTTPGIYSYTVTVTDKNGCTAQATSRVEIAPVEAVYETPKIVCLSGIAFGPPPRLEGSVTPSQLQYNYSWSVPSSQARTYLSSLVVANPEIIRFPNAPTTVTYTLSAWTDEGCSTRTEVTVHFVLPPTVTLAPTATGCARQPIPLSASSETGLFYHWEPATGLSNPNIPNPTLTLNNPGTYTYTVTVKDANGCETRKSIAVTVAPTPALTVSSPEQLCPGSDGGEISFGSEPSATSYTITTPTGTFTTDNNNAYFPINPSQTTTYTITAHLGNCSETKTITVHVPQISVAFNPQTVNTCSNSPVTLAPSSVGQDVYYYTWTPATGLSNSGIRNPVFTPPGAGTYTYTLMVMNREQDPSCTATAQVTVTVPFTPSVTINSTTICKGGEATLTASESFLITSYTWTPGNFLGGNSITVHPEETTTYTVNFTTVSGCTGSATATVTVNKINVNLTPVNPTVLPGESITLHATVSPEKDYIYKWTKQGETTPIAEGHNRQTLVITVPETLPAIYCVEVIDPENSNCKEKSCTKLTGLSCLVNGEEGIYLRPESASELLDQVAQRNPNWVVNGNTIQNVTIAIAGDLVIDQDLILQNSTIHIEDGHGINVNENRTLTLHHSKLTRCQTQWKGVSIGGSSVTNHGAIVADNNSTIEYAVTGIALTGTGRFRLTNSTLQHNTTHIEINNHEQAIGRSGSHIYGCFLYDAQYGISVKRTLTTPPPNIFIGGVGPNLRNTFTFLTDNFSPIGIDIDYSQVTTGAYVYLDNNEFICNRGFSFNNKAIGINMIGNSRSTSPSVLILGMDANRNISDGCSFSNFNTAVAVKNQAEVTIRSCKFHDNTEYGVYGVGIFTDIDYSKFTRSGFYTEKAQIFLSNIVSRNSISSGGINVTDSDIQFHLKGIEIRNVTITSKLPEFVVIKGNTFNCDNTRAERRAVSLTNVQTTFAQKGGSREVLIENNKIRYESSANQIYQGVPTGIYVSGTDPSLTILKNTIELVTTNLDLPKFQGRGIHVALSNPPPKTGLWIANNKIIGARVDGIYATGIRGYLEAIEQNDHSYNIISTGNIACNDIFVPSQPHSLTSNAWARGINLQNCFDATVARNEISTTSLNQAQLNGIYFTNCRNSRPTFSPDVQTSFALNFLSIGNNTLTNLNRAIELNGNNYWTTLQGNLMNNCIDCITFSDRANTGSQLLPPNPDPRAWTGDNVWTGNITNHILTNTATSGDDQKFIVRQGLPDHFPTERSFIGAATQVPVQEVTNHHDYIGNPNFAGWNGGFFTCEDAGANFLTIPPQDNPTPEAVYQEISTHLIRNLSQTPNPNHWGSVENDYIQRTYAYEIINQVPILRQNSVILQHAYDSLKTTNVGRFYQIDSLFFIGDTLGAITLNGSISPENTIEANQKNFNTVYFNTLFSITDSSSITGAIPHCLTHGCCHTLRSIANQCPLLGGKAVYQARALLTTRDTVTVLYDDACLYSQLRTEPSNIHIQKQTLNSFSVYPNPAREKVYVSYQQEKSSESQLKVYDATGKQVSDYPLTGETNLLEIETKDWSEGIYSFVFTDQKGSLQTLKLVITK